MNKGTVKWFDGKKGFGFIIGEDEKDYFVHQSSIIMAGFRKLNESQVVEFEIKENDKGLEAFNVTPMD